MIFLLEYDRSEGRLLRERLFEDDQIEQVDRARLEAELASVEVTNLEIVTLRSKSRDELIETHGRYYKTLEELSRRS